MRLSRRLSLCRMGAVEKDGADSRCFPQRIEDFAACWILLVRQLSPVRSRVGEQRCTEAVSAPTNQRSPELCDNGTGASGR